VQVHGPTLKLDEQWNEKFRLLQEYHSEHGDCLVPKDYIIEENKINWDHGYRVTHAAGKLREDRSLQLESLDFSFRALPDDSVQAQWDRRFKKLVRHKQENGHCLVPKAYKEDPQFGIWVSGQRRYRDLLSQDQRAKLDGLGFIWDVLDTQWQVQFVALQRFQKQQGHFCVTNVHQAEYPGLELWVLNHENEAEWTANGNNSWIPSALYGSCLMPDGKPCW
jgi:hypothetical protein